MADDEKPETGTILGVPYNFERPNLRRLLSSYWQPGQGMLVEKPFGVGYTLNLASWRSWVVIAVAAALFYQERSGPDEDEEPVDDDDDDGGDPVEVIVED